MDLQIPHLSPHRRNKHQYLLLTHPKSLPQQEATNSLKIPLNVSKRPEPNFLELGILGPSVGRPFECLSRNVDEAGFFETLFVVNAFIERTAESQGAFGG